MKWFKHYSNADSSTKLNRIIDEMGVEGYARYWLLLELLSSHFDGESTYFEIHENQILAKLRIKFSKKLATFMQKLSNFQLIKFKTHSKVWQIDAPILLELLGKDFKYNRKRIVANDAKNKNKIKNKNKEEKVVFEIGPEYQEYKKQLHNKTRKQQDA